MRAPDDPTPAPPQAVAPSSPPSTSVAFELAAQGTLTIIDLFGAAQALTEAGQMEQVIALYRLWLKSTQSPLTYAVYFNLGAILSNIDDGNHHAAAEQAYRHSLSLKPDFIEANLNLGSLQERQGEPELALETWRKALEIINPSVAADRPFYTQTLNNLGRLLEIRKRFPEAEEMLRRSLEIDPKQPNAITHWVHLRQKQCKWPIYSPIEGLSTADMVDATSALAMLSASGDPAVQLAAARRHVEAKVLSGVAPLSKKGSSYGHRRLRIGYLSSDFCSHAVSILTAELFELHDRDKVEVFGFCWSHEDGSPLRARVVKAMDHHIRIGALSDEQAAHCIREHEIDILIDLHGLTLGTRPGILAYRPAPLQMTYLGFPGSTALPSIDYVLCDKFVLPPELAPYFTEKPLYLPNTFQINDRQRAIGPRPSKASCGLPDDAFIFCSFNNNHKFTPEVFASWMRILKRAPSSVLWLIADSEQIRENLWQEAERHGVARARLYFAGRVMPADYLARYQVADLFLDTLPFNAGTTASDALWAGLPLLTCAGRTFASRMAGSLLMAADLPQLITYSLDDYEDKAVELAEHPEQIAAMKQQLADNRLSCALFDSPRFVRALEAALLQVAGMPDTVAASASASGTSVKKFTFGYIRRQPETHERYLGKSLSLLRGQFEVISTSDEHSPAHNYNALLNLCQTEFLILADQDVSFPPDLLQKIEQTIAARPDFGALGMVGKDRQGNTRWSADETIFEVDTLDRRFLIVRRNTPARFDTTNFGECHLYVEDFCAQISRLQGKKIYTLLIASDEQRASPSSADSSEGKLVQHSASDGETGDRRGRYPEFRSILAQKWGELQTT